ncbi:MAG TPA: 50S ribosomal protein L25 [Candidatus Paceibacterota bacterium]|nr:50S ribosomal protein L25 [Candidatus Paceibacterota bacterium]
MVKKETQLGTGLTLKVEERTVTGKKTADLRAKGILPGVVYGPELKPFNVQVSKKDFAHVYAEAGDSGLIELLLGAKKINVLVHDIAYTADASQDPIHVDFYQVNLNKAVTAEVPLVFVGESPAVKDGGVLTKSIEGIEVEALPKDLPHDITVDLSVLKDFDSTLYVKDLIIPANVKVIVNGDNPVVTVSAPISDEELKAMEQENQVNVSEIKTEKEEKAETASAESPSVEGETENKTTVNSK